MAKTEEGRGTEVIATKTSTDTSINDINNKILNELDDETPKTFPQIVSRIFSSISHYFVLVRVFSLFFFLFYKSYEIKINK